MKSSSVSRMVYTKSNSCTAVLSSGRAEAQVLPATQLDYLQCQKFYATLDMFYAESVQESIGLS